MQKLTREEYSSEALQRRLRSVTFFKDLFQLDPIQYELVLSLSEFVRVKAADTVIERGDVGGNLFFLLKGQIAVYNEEGQQSLNVINPGEVVGTLSMITGRARSATVKAESNAILVGLEHQYFRDTQDHSLLNLNTKLLAYRMIVHNIRWTLEMNKMKDPKHPLVARLSKMPLLTGNNSFQEELEFLHKQSKVLAELLYDWNDAIVAPRAPLSA